MADADQSVVFANSRMGEILDIPKHKLIGMHLAEVLTPQHVNLVQELVNLVCQDQQQQTSFCSILDKPQSPDHIPRVFETCLAVSRLDEKVFTCLYLRDLSNRILIERELQKTNAFLANIIQNSVDGIVVVDTKGVPLIFNQGAERILGYKTAEIIGNPENFRRFYPVPVAAEMMRRMRSQEYGPPDKLNTTRISFFHKSGEEVPVNFSATIIRERGQEVGSVGIFTDLREILKVHRELEAVQSQLVHTEKIASLGRMAAGVAHEINNPLAIIRQEAEWIRQLLAGQKLRDAPEWGEIQDSLREIIQQVERSREITHNLLNLALPREPVIQEVNLNKLVADMSALVEREAGQHNIKIVRDLQSDLPLLYSDPPLLRQVILNLLNNAQQAIQQDGVISIATRSTPDGYVNLTVTDTGGGIAAEDLPKIFHPFFTTKPPGQVTVLGLAICHRILDELGGRIAVASQVGQGATFTVSLPLKAKKDQD